MSRTKSKKQVGYWGRGRWRLQGFSCKDASGTREPPSGTTTVDTERMRGPRGPLSPGAFILCQVPFRNVALRVARDQRTVLQNTKLSTSKVSSHPRSSSTNRDCDLDGSPLQAAAPKGA